MKKQLTSMSNLAIPYKLTRRFQGILKKDFPAYHQQKKIFENWKDIYKLPLLQFGYKENLNCTEKNNKIDQKTQKCIILWFNPPYSKSVKTNIDKLYLCLISKPFPPTHKYRKIFNGNTIKINYNACPTSNQKLVILNKIKQTSKPEHPKM